MSARALAATGPLRRAAAMSTRRRGRLALSTLLSALTVLAGAALLATSGYLISRAAQQPPILTLTVAIVGVRFFAIARALLRYSERLISHDLALRNLADLRSRFFARLIPLVPGALHRGGLLSRFVGDVDELQNLYLRGLAPVLAAVPAGAAAVALAVVMEPRSGLVLAACLVVAAVVLVACTALAAGAASRRQSPARAALTSQLVETIAGARELASAGREESAAEKVRALEERLLGLQRRDALAGSVASGLAAALPSLAAVAIAASAIPAVHAGTLDGTLLAALVLLALASFEAITPLGPAAQRLGASAHAAERLEEVTESEPPVEDPAHPRALPSEGPLTVERVRARWGPEEPWILDGVSLHVERGRATALLGPSGSGKSTLAELLVRFRDPDDGCIRVGGVDLRAVEQADLRRTVRLDGQDAHLFAADLGRNLRLARPSATDAELEQALEHVGLGDWLRSLPEGLGTQVGEHGREVSGGQRQRIAAARLLLSEAPFLVFDEPAAHLDPHSAGELMAELARTAHEHGQGVLVVTHELPDPRHFDDVLELRDGVVNSIGRPRRPMDTPHRGS